jgi:hypothetical protein
MNIGTVVFTLAAGFALLIVCELLISVLICLFKGDK